jgi:N6-adenosine-specific RNA methylase IME4
MSNKQGGYEMATGGGKETAISILGCTLTRTGIVFDDGITGEQWHEVLRNLERFDEVSRWGVGDALLLQEDKGAEWGSKYDEIVEEFGQKYGSAANAKYVAKRFVFSRRRENLPFSWHQEVAPLDQDDQEELLNWAETRDEQGRLPSQKELRQRVREIRRAERLAATPDLPEGVYRVIYADPPWEYGDKRTNDANSGSAESQYPTMPIEAICDMPVCDIAASDSVLFLWATAPLLTEAVQVIESWGFTYKAQFVWDKVKGFNGHYNDVRHELLLVATRGSCVPKIDTLDPSIVQAKRTQHSRKPDCFYELIERMYPPGERTHVELFARRSRNGWQSWGNQVDAASR